MSATFNHNLRQARGLLAEAVRLAEKGISECNDDSCTTLWSSLKTEAERIEGLVDAEIAGHQAKGKWD